MNYFSFFNQSLKKINYQTKLKIFLLSFFVSIIVSIFYSFYFITQYSDLFLIDTYNIIVKKIPFGYGDLLNNLIEYNKYANTEGFEFYLPGKNVEYLSIDFTLKKLPFYTYFLYILLSISKNIFFLITIKFLIFFYIFYFIVYFSLKSLNSKLITFVLILTFFFIVPYNIKTFLEISFADSITSILLSCLYLITISKIQFKFVYVGFILFILYLTKESMFAICVIFPLALIYFNYKYFKKLIFIPILFVTSAVLLWGFFGVVKTGSFPFGSSLSTWKSYDMSKSLDVKFSDYYPKFSTDFIDSTIISERITNEWDFYNYHKNKNMLSIKNNPKIILKNTLLKIKFVLFNIKPDGYQYKNKINSDTLFIISSLINKFIFYISIILLLFQIIKKTFHKNEMSFYYFIILILNLAPHIVGWATSKHLVGIYLMSFIFIILIFEKKFTLKKYRKVA